MISTFINKYIKSPNQNYTDSIIAGPYIYAVGQGYTGYNGKGLVTKINMAGGAVVWEKNYFSDNISFDNILRADNGELLINGSSSSPSQMICRINSNGDLLWTKRYTIPAIPPTFSSFVSSKLLKLNGDAYLLYAKVSYRIDMVQYETIHIIKIDGSGNIIAKKTISVPTSQRFDYSASITTDGVRTMLIVSRVSHFELIILDAALNIYSKNRLTFNSVSGANFVGICDVNYVDGQFIFNGHIGTGSNLRAFIGKVPLPNSGQVLTGNVTIKLLNESYERCYFTGESGNYFLSGTDNNSGRKVIRLDSAFNVLWYKGLRMHTRHLRLSINHMLVSGDNILGCITDTINLASCKTVNLPAFDVATDYLTYSTVGTVNLADSSTAAETLTPTINTVTSVIEDVCAAIVVPEFTQVGPICAGSPLAPLPTTSLNNITGSWSPAMNNQSTTTYTFTPGNSSAATVTMTIVVNPQVTPAFTQVGPIYTGDPLSPLPTVSNNNISGSWSPALNNQATTTYTFTPNGNQCALSTTMTITVNQLIVPEFNQVGPICAGSTLAALPTTSLNGISGSWSPAINNQATTTYTFTPTAGSHATTVTMTIVVTQPVVPQFTQVQPIYVGNVLNALPTTSLNGISGSWSPAINNQATTTYSFTPNNGQCATTATMTITVNPLIVPAFNQVGPICSGSELGALPTTSLNGISGSWFPAVNNQETTTYTFTPSGNNATTVTMTITVTPLIMPEFTPILPIVAGDPIPILPTTSLNGISGSWLPPANNLYTTIYTFTPQAGQCAHSTSMTVVVKPCASDENLCELREKLLKIFIECIKAPDTIKTPKEIKAVKKCLEAFLTLLIEFGSQNPDYELVKILAQQIKTIELFIKSDENYDESWDAVVFILDYLAEVGNCNCENVLEIKKNTALQSSHLYLQAAGSVGEDSTMGIHLRWSLKDALESHLPKGNYATSFVNFNKPDDYLKVYRAHYKEIKVTLDLGRIPDIVHDSISHAQKHWIYNVSANSNYAFYVYFRDTLRYQQTKAIIDPEQNPYEFINAYGNKLIEVECNTELSFAVKLNFKTHQQSNSVKIELLSVEKNKMTAPRGASHRKTYSAAVLNETKIFAENIRSIRFISQNTTIKSINFEFYSQFISESYKDRGWDYIGRFALTKDSKTAYKRLEPKDGILTKWLRYNDNAYVNVKNYKTRWDGSNLDEENTIKDVVKKYINYSDHYSNPLANEFVSYGNQEDVTSCIASNEGNDGVEYEYNPDNPGFEVSNLSILQLAGLDFHIARMLGLGALDFDPKVNNGQFIYMAEYVSVGDLRDGLGPRELQHLYCSLPTALEDQRLPIPIDLKDPVYGAFYGYGEDEPERMEGIDIDGYTADGSTRFISLFSEELPDELLNAPFYYSQKEIDSAASTVPVFAGLEYCKTGKPWVKPELSYDQDYFNIDDTVDYKNANETKAILIPESGLPMFVHKERNNGSHDYCGYGINWFSRATISQKVKTVITAMRPVNNLLPPTNVNALLIIDENPLFLTTAQEQLRRRNIPEDNDNTLIRLTFDYNHGQELKDHHKTINGQLIKSYQPVANNMELFAEEIELFFRNQIPQSISGKVKLVTTQGSSVLMEIHTEPYEVLSAGMNTNMNPPEFNEVFVPVITPGTEANYIGSILLVNDIQYLIHEIDNQGVYPKFTVLKSTASSALTGSTNSNPSQMQVPNPGDLFVVVENMQNDYTWRTPSTLPIKKFNIDLKTIYEEEITIHNVDCTTETHIQKFRGVFHDNCIVTRFIEEVDVNNDGSIDSMHMGIYKIVLQGFTLGQHSQYSLDGDSVEWYNGIVRLHTVNDPDGPRKEFKVVRTENIGSTNNEDLIIYVEDLTFPTDLNLMATYKGKIIHDDEDWLKHSVNYYPSYKVFLYADAAAGLSEDAIVPVGDNGELKYSIFGLRSYDYAGEVIDDGIIEDNTEPFYSKISPPTLMFARANVEPEQPALPLGGLYATRPDFFGKASYTFRTEYVGKPYSVQFNRASDIQILSVIYDNTILYDENNEIIPESVPTTLQQVMNDYFELGEEEYYTSRWADLLNFKVIRGGFGMFPPAPLPGGKVLPFPDNANFIASINAFIADHNDFYRDQPPVPDYVLSTASRLDDVIIPHVNLPNGSVRNSELKFIDFMKDIIHNCFVPLTEIPVIYDHIKPDPYKPIPKKQMVRDRNGNLMLPSDAAFDMAPMMKRYVNNEGKNETQFTDFGLDGASNAKFFYAAREINVQLKTSDYSQICGPVNLVNTAPPTAPEIVKVTPVLADKFQQISPAVRVEINPYTKNQKIRKINLYRAINGSDALSVRTMKHVKEIDIEAAGISEDIKWIFTDDFSDLPQVPYGELLYYRITVSRIIKYNDKNFDPDSSTGNNVPIIDYAPSEASNVVMTNIVESSAPPSPVLDYVADGVNPDGSINFVTLHWNLTAYKAIYHLYKLNAQGDWLEIAKIVNNGAALEQYNIEQMDASGNWVVTGTGIYLQNRIYLSLRQTNLNTDVLTVENEGVKLYHHFKVVAQNSAGMLSQDENKLTIYTGSLPNQIGGIGEMIISGTFIVR